MFRSIILCFAFLLLIFSVKSQDFQDRTENLYNFHKGKFEEFEKDHRRRIKFKSHELTYLQWGNHLEKVFVWLPGSLLSAYDFYPFADSLLHDGYTVLSIDHYGHGLTEIPQEDLDFWDFADDLNSLLEQMGIKKAVIAGFSRGAYLASAFYEKYPEKVSAIVLEDGGSVSFKSMFQKLTPEDYTSFLKNLKVPKEVEELLFQRYNSEVEIFNNFSTIDDSESRWQNLGFVRKNGDQYIMYNGLNEYMHMQDSLHYTEVLNQGKQVSRYASSIVRVNPLHIYKSLDVPMLIMEAIGEPDLFKTTEENKKLRDLHPTKISLKQFDCDNHNIHFGCPDKFISEVRKFLRSL